MLSMPTADETNARIKRFSAMKAQFPQSEMPRWSLATTYEDADRFQEAIAEFRELVAIKPDYCVAFLHLGSCLIEEEAYDEAIAALEEAKRLAVAQGHDEPRLKAEALIAIAEDERDD